MNASDLTLAIRERTTCEEPMGSRTHQANRTNPVHFAQVEYAHVVAYFRSNLPNPVRSVARIAERLQEVPGKGEFEVLVWTSAGPVKRRGGSLAPLLAEAGQHPESERIRCVLIGRERRGAQAKLVDSLWHSDYLAEEVYEIAQSDCSVVSTIRLNGFLPDTASIEHEEDAKRVSSQSLSARAASRELIEDVVRLALGCPGV